jgi:hypothetical protein
MLGGAVTNKANTAELSKKLALERIEALSRRIADDYKDVPIEVGEAEINELVAQERKLQREQGKRSSLTRPL